MGQGIPRTKENFMLILIVTVVLITTRNNIKNIEGLAHLRMDTLESINLTNN